MTKIHDNDIMFASIFFLNFILRTKDATEINLNKIPTGKPITNYPITVTFSMYLYMCVF